MKYQVEIIETLSRVIEIEAENKMDALDAAYKAYYDGEEIVLDSNDFQNVEFCIFG